MKKRLAPMPILLVAALAGAFSCAVVDGAPKPPLVVNCGPSDRDLEEEAREEESRTSRSEPVELRRLRDVRYTEDRGYGHEGGEGFRHWFAGTATIWGRPERDLFASGRSSPEAYRFDLPAGRYIVLLGVCQLEEHLEVRRRFDVTAQGRTVMSGVDPFAIAGYGQSFRLASVVEVHGRGGLTIGLRRRRESRRSPFVNAIWVHPERDRDEPGRPARPRGAGSYGMNVLFWDAPSALDVAGYIVERRVRGETSFRRLTPRPVPVVRWLDHEASPGTAYRYRLRAVDLRGRHGPPSRALSLEPRAVEESSFPVYSLSLKDHDLAALYRDVRSDRTVPAVFSFGGTDYFVRVRIRGNVSRHAAKLSYRVTFLEATPFPGRRVIYIKAEPRDFTLQQTKLTCDVFAALGTPASRASYVNLLINGRYQGVYLDVERVDRAFLERRELRGTLFRAGSFQRLGGEPGRKRGGTGSRRELPELIRAINRVDRGEFESFVREATDWPAVRDYLVASTLCHRSEIEANDYFYCHVSGERWILLPWDHNNGNFGVFGSRVRGPFMPLFGQTLQGTGHWNNYWYALASRILHSRSFRREYVDRLERAAREWLASGKVEDFIVANHEALHREILVDPYRWPPGEDEPFERSAGDLRRFVRRHATRLLEEIDRERRRPESPVVINEFQLGPRGGWVELRNRGARTVPLAGFSLGSLDGAYRAWREFEPGARLEAGELRVVDVKYRPRTRLVDRDDDPEWLEALERAELEGRPLPLREPDTEGSAVPGGTVALVGPLRSSARERKDRDASAEARESEDARDAEARERDRLADAEPALIDWYFFGHQTDGFSYGRIGGGFAFLNPTPGEANPERGLEPPPLLSDGGRRGRRGGPVRVYADIDPSAVRRLPDSVRLHYSFGGPWRELPMEIDERSPRSRFVAAVPTTNVMREISYYFVARTSAGIERRAPLTAPVETYTRELEGD